MDANDKAHIDRIAATIAELGLVEVCGHAVSQFGKPYNEWYLGWVQSAGSPAMDDGLPLTAKHVDSRAAAVNAAIRDITIAASGVQPAKAIVWYSTPDWHVSPKGAPRHPFGLYFRCHFLSEVPALSQARPLP